MIGVLIIGIGFGICASLLGINLIHRYYYKDFKPDIGELSEEDAAGLSSFSFCRKTDSGKGIPWAALDGASCESHVFSGNGFP